MPELYPFECECEDPDIDPVSGHARCFTCGRSWFLSDGERLHMVHMQAAYDRWCEETEQTTKETQE